MSVCVREGMYINFEKSHASGTKLSTSCAQDSISVTMQVYCMCMCCMCDKYMVSGCVHNNVCGQVCPFMYMYTL